MSTWPAKILVVGQTPPPFGGQAVMIQVMLEGDYGPRVRLHHVRMAFSYSMGEMGHFRFRKMLELLRVITLTVWYRLRHRANVLYYCPAGPTRWPVLRDIAILTSVRWMFRRTILHFHAGGVGGYYWSLPRILRPFFRMAYWNHDVGIRVSPYSFDDPGELHCRRTYIVPNGIADAREDYEKRASQHAPVPSREGTSEEIRLLYCGLVSEEKGFPVLLKALESLRAKGLAVMLRVVGEFESEGFGQHVRAFIRDVGFSERVEFLGVLTGAGKLSAFAGSDIVCIPTFVRSENAPLVALEAMCFGLPVVATRWGGIPGVVEDGVSGFLVPPRDAEALAERIEQLARDRDLRRTLGENGRGLYLDKFTVTSYHSGLRKVFLACLA